MTFYSSLGWKMLISLLEILRPFSQKEHTKSFKQKTLIGVLIPSAIRGFETVLIYFVLNISSIKTKARLIFPHLLLQVKKNTKKTTSCLSVKFITHLIRQNIDKWFKSDHNQSVINPSQSAISNNYNQISYFKTSDLILET